MYYSTAEDVCLVREIFSHDENLDSDLNKTCGLIIGNLKPTNTKNFQAGITPTKIRREVASYVKCGRKISDDRHLLYERSAAKQRLKLGKVFSQPRINALNKLPIKEKKSFGRKEGSLKPSSRGMRINPSDLLTRKVTMQLGLNENARIACAA